jgi:hypothetical protein
LVLVSAEKPAIANVSLTPGVSLAMLAMWRMTSLVRSTLEASGI